MNSEALRGAHPWSEIFDTASALLERHGWRALVADLAAPQGGSGAGRPLAPLFRKIREIPTDVWASALAPAALVGAGAAATTARREAASPSPELPLEDRWERSLQIPERDAPLGPVSRARQQRMLAILAGLELAAIVGARAAPDPRREAFAVGMMAPGAGFIYTRDPVYFAVAVSAFVLTLLLWWATANILLPPAVWVAAAAVAGRRASARGGWRPAIAAVPTALAGVGVYLGRRQRSRFKSQVAAGRELNEVLATVRPPLRGADRPAPDTVGPELNDFELGLTRTLVDIGLQAPDDWSNYNLIEQFQSASLRYQINFNQWALAMQQFTRVPAFRGYLSAAQQALFAKYQEKKVWSYWFWENLWGNLELNPDPIRRQNIMMTGFCALGVGLYENATGDMRFSRPGAFRFRWSDSRVFDYSLEDMCRAMVDDMTRSPWSAMVCEPNWLFAFCNTVGNSALMIHDRLHGTAFHEATRRGFERAIDEEFSNPDGSLNWYRSTRTGLGLSGSIFSTELRPLMPDIADRGWALARRAFVDDGGQVRTPLRNVDRLVDGGNYSYGPLPPYAAMIGAAREVGEERLAQAALDELLDRLPPHVSEGGVRFDGASLSGTAQLGRALFGRKAGWLDAVTRGRPAAWDSGPVLATVPYPEVLVARAVSDGARLELVLRTGTDPGRRALGLAQLEPGRDYDVTGALESSVTAKRDGTATISVDLDGRAEVSVAPRA